MTPDLSPLLQKFIQAKNTNDARMFVACFTDDAMVTDDGREFEGREAIGAWAEETNKRYKLTLTPTDVSEDGDETVLTALASGDFDGSPAELQYHMRLEGGKIASMNVRS
jgi:uncharacterized protein (TIGR02246 family)